MPHWNTRNYRHVGFADIPGNYLLQIFTERYSRIFQIRKITQHKARNIFKFAGPIKLIHHAINFVEILINLLDKKNAVFRINFRWGTKTSARRLRFPPTTGACASPVLMACNGKVYSSDPLKINSCRLERDSSTPGYSNCTGISA